MPLLLSKPIHKTAAYAVWNIQETNQMLLDLIEEETPAGLHPTKLAEWIVGRILIKSLATQYGISYQGVAKHETGKPFLKGSDAEISISNSFPMAAALIDLKKPCGIDLERTRSKLIRISDKFINESEKEYAKDLGKLCAIWCGKEVLYKIHGRKKLSMKEDTSIEFVSDDVMTGYIHAGKYQSKHRIHYEPVKDFYLAYSL